MNPSSDLPATAEDVTHAAVNVNACGDMLRDAGVSTLSPAHRAMLEQESNIHPRVTSARGYFTVQDRRDLPKLGFSAHSGNVLALAIPQHSPDEKTITWTLRLDNPTPDKEGKVHKYLQASGARLVVDCNPLALPNVKDSDIPLWVTEGSKKSDCAISHGITCVSISGVYCWRNKSEPLPCWEYIPLRGREVVIAFDSDVMTKPSVYNALKRFASFLRGRGAEVNYLYLPQESEDKKVGIDDFLAAGHTVAELKALVASELRPPQTVDGELSRLEVSDVDNAQRFSVRFGEEFRFNHSADKWFHWDGWQWNSDERGKATERMKETISKIFYEAAACGDETRRDALVSGAKKCRSAIRIQGALTMAKTLPVFSTVFEDYDANPFRLNTASGILTLDTQTTDPHDPLDMMTKICPAPYDKAAKCPKWEGFLNRILPDPGVQLFVQKAVGYSLSGSTDEQAFFFCYGNGANGKSVFLSVLERLASQYGVRVPIQTLLKDKYNSGGAERPSPQLVKLRGARLVMTSEMPKMGQLNDELVKDLTGGDSVSCRDMYAKPFTFTPQLKLWLYGNHKPQISASDDGIWRRVRLIPFTEHIPQEQRIAGLDKQLFEELPGILRWAVDGYALWRKDGLKVPKAIEDANIEYRHEEDTLAAFVEYACELNQTAQITKKELWEKYILFSELEGEKVYRTQRAFNADVKRLEGVTDGRSGKTRDKCWFGIKVKDIPGDEADSTPTGSARKVSDVLRRDDEDFDAKTDTADSAGQNSENFPYTRTHKGSLHETETAQSFESANPMTDVQHRAMFG